jgi:hypothetical protein
VLQLRECRSFYFDASSDASKQYPNTSFLQILVTNPFALRLFSSLFHFCSIRSFVDLAKGRDQYPYLPYCSSESIALYSPHGCTRCWFARVSDLLESVGISMDRLHEFRYSLDKPGHLLPTT